MQRLLNNWADVACVWEHIVELAVDGCPTGVFCPCPPLWASATTFSVVDGSLCWIVWELFLFDAPTVNFFIDKDCKQNACYDDKIVINLVKTVWKNKLSKKKIIGKYKCSSAPEESH